MQNLLNSESWLQQPRLVAGVMSGTSFDGIDVAIARFSKIENKFTMNCIATASKNFTPEQRAYMLDLIESQSLLSSVSDLHFYLSSRYAMVIQSACTECELELGTIDAVGAHGQTFWHSPTSHKFLEMNVSSTLQLCSIPALAKMLMLPVVGDFRSADIALGGQGAPLVPIFDFEFLRSESHSIVALNIGGMANITVLPAGCRSGDVQAFDTGPGNVWIDAAVRRYYDRSFDGEGEIARSGKLDNSLLTVLKSIEYIHKLPPKSTGREEFSMSTLDGILATHAHGIDSSNLITTLTHFTSWSIAENIRRCGIGSLHLVVSGGGSKNHFLLELLRAELPNATVVSSDHMGISSQFKEALCFAFLAYRTLGSLPSSISAVTGASRDSVLGAVSFP